MHQLTITCNYILAIQLPYTNQRTRKKESMKKAQVVVSLGQKKLILPAWVKAALSSNDRLKVYLTVLQAASSHASHPNRNLPDLVNEIAAAGLNTGWLHDVAATATRIDEDLFIADLSRLVKCLADELRTMARPVLETTMGRSGTSLSRIVLARQFAFGSTKRQTG